LWFARWQEKQGEVGFFFWVPHVFGEPLLFGLRFVAESEVFRKNPCLFGKNVVPDHPLDRP
jgi:hypothetical protein